MGLSSELIAALVAQFIALLGTIIAAELRRERRITRMETKLDMLYNFWETKLERRSRSDQDKWQQSHPEQ